MAPEAPLVRHYRDDDLGRVVRLFEREGLTATAQDGLSLDEATDLMGSPLATSLVAERGSDIVGVALATVVGTVATVFRVAGDDDVRGRLLNELETTLADDGARRVAAVVRRDSSLSGTLVERGYRPDEDLTVLERELTQASGDTSVAELGGRMVDPDLWGRLDGMEHVKQIIERRIILPLAEPALAARHSVAPPHAVVLFGPPGTGKTTFAQGVASRLEWPFVPMEPTQLSSGDDDRDTLDTMIGRILELPSAVAFVDEVEDVASIRNEDRKVGPSMTNEFLRHLTRFRSSPRHLLICATNWVGRLDPAFLRPGRFDYVLPVGPPDAAARRAIWRGYVQDITDLEVDLDAVVGASERFTPADIEFAARKAAQFAFEREYFEDTSPGRATTQEFLDAIEETPPSLTDEILEAFERDVEQFARS